MASSRSGYYACAELASVDPTEARCAKWKCVR
jgi:hypothetical protein